MSLRVVGFNYVLRRSFNVSVSPWPQRNTKKRNLTVKVRIRSKYSANPHSLEGEDSKSAISASTEVPTRDLVLVFVQIVSEEIGQMDSGRSRLLHSMNTSSNPLVVSRQCLVHTKEGRLTNARDFVGLLESPDDPKGLRRVKYFVFGCGHKA